MGEKAQAKKGGGLDHAGVTVRMSFECPYCGDYQTHMLEHSFVEGKKHPDRIKAFVTGGVVCKNCFERIPVIRE